ncbi:MAG: DUF4199 domain-containing protein [Bacteroidia bacterium]
MKIAIKYGLIYSGINILWNLVMYITELNRTENARIYQSLGLVFMITCIVMAINEYKKSEGNGFVDFGAAFKQGLVITAISGIIGALYFVVYIKYIDPSYNDFILQQQVDKFAEMGMSEADIEKAVAQTAKFLTPFWMFTFGILGSLFFGSVISLIIAAIMKKPNPNEIA